MDRRPIAVFDSGLGGLSVWREVRRLLPAESILYYGDGKNCPYGPKSKQEVTGYVMQAARFLLEEKGAKMLIVACNAATAAAIGSLRETYPDIPIVGMEPAVKPAALTSKTGVVGILATRATLDGNLFLETARRYGNNATILPAVGEGFVELVEAGLEDSPQAVEAVRRVMEPMLEKGADRIVLGCTHYPFLEGAMRRVIGPREVELIDPAPAIARRAEELLGERGLLNERGEKPVYEFFTAGDNDYLKRIEAKANNL